MSVTRPASPAPAALIAPPPPRADNASVSLADVAAILNRRDVVADLRTEVGSASTGVKTTTEIKACGTRDADFLQGATIVGYDLLAIVAIAAIFRHGRIRDALKEKSGEATVVTRTVTPAVAGVAGATQTTETSEARDTSTSRVAALIGSTGLAIFFVALGNWLLADAFETCGQRAAELMENVWLYFVAGSTLFLPYAVNQLGAAIKGDPKSTG